MRRARTMHSKGYWLLYNPEHLFANNGGYVPEQRLVMERVIGRLIDPSVEDVHHRDGVVTNNAIDNLELLSKKHHRRLHAGWKLIGGQWWKICTRCGRFLVVEGNFYHRRTGHSEFVTQCKECACIISSKKRPPRLSLKERSIIARLGAYASWEKRRRNAKGGD